VQEAVAQACVRLLQRRAAAVARQVRLEQGNDDGTICGVLSAKI
jgi:hypothetical protein